MNMLILSLILVPFLAFADDVQEISNGTITNKFLTVVKDAEVEKMLGASAEFNDCREKYKFKPTDDAATRKDNLAKATACFKAKITTKDGAALKKLGDDLKLENYGLIKSNNVNEITAYLSKKMTKSLTGVDPDEKDPVKLAEQMKWGNKKIVDQKVFIDLYKNQLIKNALFEVSRFCLENLRNTTNPSKNSFDEHWSGGVLQSLPVDADKNPVISTAITDTGVPSFIDNKLDSTDMSKESDVQAKIISGLATGKVDGKFYGAFFAFCQAAIPQLCKVFRDAPPSVSGGDGSKSGSTMTRGANACLTMDKLQGIRKSMANTDKVEKQFAEMDEGQDKLAIQMLTEAKTYKRGQGDNEESLDQLSSYSSSDMLQNSKDKQLEDLEKKCQQNRTSECDAYLVKGDSLDKALYTVDQEMTLKKEVELDRVRKMKDKEERKKYLEENGYFEIVNKLDQLSDAEIETELGKIFDARRVAEIEALKANVGKRQMTETEYNALGADKQNTQILENIAESKTERARLAQVVMFNNIITSQLSLSRKVGDKTEDVGRNVSGWNKEKAGLDKSGGYDNTLFSGIQKTAEEEGSKLKDTSIQGAGIIDMILGSKK